ncbi:MAG: KGG domain-containing protein, partial [Massilia sp.]
GGNRQSGGQGDTSNRGFASMDPEKQRAIAAEGGRASHASGNAHEFTSEEAREAGHLSHKNDGNQQSGGDQGGSSASSSGGRGGSSGSSSGGSQQSGSGGSKGGSGGSSGGTRGGTPEQHAEAGRQSHKNDQK